MEMSVYCILWILLKVDCEMTGLNVDTDKLLEIAVIVTEGDTLATVDKTVSGDQWEAIIAARDLNPYQSQESIVIHCDDRSLDTCIIVLSTFSIYVLHI